MDIHAAIQSANGLLWHEPTILVQDIQAFPAAVEFIRLESRLGRMSPQVHGWTHAPYHSLPPERLAEDLRWCLDWFDRELNWLPTKFYSPWGGDTPIMREVAAANGLGLVGACRNETLDRLLLRLRKGEPPRLLEGTWLWHWWSGSGPISEIADMLTKRS